MQLQMPLPAVIHRHGFSFDSARRSRRAISAMTERRDG
jgi:hypothetical protein